MSIGGDLQANPDQQNAGTPNESSRLEPRLHGVWLSPSLILWGEVGLSPRSTEAPADDSESSERRFLSIAELHAEAGEVSPDGLLASVADDGEIELRLPEQDGVKAVPCLRLDAADAIDFLTSLGRKADRRLGDSVRYWAILAKYVCTLLTRRQFAPDLDIADGNRIRGRWRVYVDSPAELRWLERVASAMPAVSLAALERGDFAAQSTMLVDTFLTETADALILRSVAGDEFFRQFHDRARKEGDWDLCWLASLLGAEGPFTWPDATDAPEIDATITQVRGWLASLEGQSGEAGAVPELVFSLRDPEEEGDVEAERFWRLSFGLRDPVTRRDLEMAGLWEETGVGPSIIRRHLVNRREHVSRELRRAASSFSPIDRVFRRSVPSGVDLSANEALGFVREAAPLLEAQGFVVRLPDWADMGERRLGMELHVSPRAEHFGGRGSDLSLDNFGLNSVIDFNWRVAVGDQHLSLEEFERLVEQQSSLVRVHGEWMELDQEAARRALAYMRKQPRGSMNLIEAMRISAGAEEVDTGLPIVGMTGTDWVARLLEGLPETSIADVRQPEAFEGELRPYQLRGLAWLAFLRRLGIGGCLADDMGLGKTIQLIALLLLEREKNADVGPTLLFVPMSVVGNWNREIRRFGKGLKTLVHHGPERLGGESFVTTARASDVVITTYGLAHRDFDTLSKVEWYRIALDEAQKIKNPSANQTIAVRKLIAPQKLALTGTPLENHLSELWSIMEMLNPGLLGSAGRFRERFAVPIERMGDRQKAADLRRLIRPFLLRRLKNDPSVECDLPEKMEMPVYCNLMAEQASLYRRVVDQMLTAIEGADGIRRRGLILTTLTRLKQVCNHPAHYNDDGRGLDGRSGKCERIVEMLEEVLEEGDAALIFTQYREMGDLLVRLFKSRLGIDVPFMHGGTTAKQRDKLVEAFQKGETNMPLFLLSLRAGGFGLNLTRANHVFHFDRWWNPAVENQATDRAHRIGQTRRVQVHKFVCIGTVEDRIDKLLQEKSALTEQIVGSGDDWLTNLSTSELRDYLTLTDEAVADE
ncbi:MAG TPA: DEAD/DEAH box helicase [Phycisphaerae bacterium]|nr:DEAD/DEAH box helicase [Phycisphaerae bacterium]HRW55782.1 DEAD/DEAH box helicase [Phycisphaerae bacterium]